jgi:NAD+ synthase (glutamine-hydrolysing)
MYRLRIALAQVNPVVGDLEGNTEKIRAFIRKARKADADIVVFPELAVTGYPPDDLLLNRRFVEDSMACVRSLIKATRGIAAVIGCIHATGKDINNAVAIIANSKLIGIYGKSFIKEKSYFDEPRYFTGGDGVPGFRIGTVDASVCFPDELALPDKGHGSRLLVCPGALPFRVGSGQEKALAGKAKKNSAVIVYANMAGGQDELVFNGESLVMDKKGRVLARGLAFEEDLLVADVDLESDMGPAGNNRHERIAIPVNRKRPCSDIKTPRENGCSPLKGYTGPLSRERGLCGEERIFEGGAGLKRRNGFGPRCRHCGGRGRERKCNGCVFMPTRYTSAESSEDAYALGENLGIGIINVR